MVCLGNICRSPVAEGVLRDKAKKYGIEMHIDSAGTSNYHVGEAPDRRSLENARQFGIDISDLRARQFVVEDFDRFDKILVMDTSNYSNVISLARNEEDKKKVMLLLDHIQPGKNMCVPDPYFGGPEGFTTVFKLIDQACENILQEELKKKRNS